MTELFSYCIPTDDGAAPNPYWGICTLVLCKPKIRSAAQVGDWVVGTGAKHAGFGNGQTRDMRGRIIYAMKVTTKMTMSEYDAYTRKRLRMKIPIWRSRDPRRRLGDSLYDFTAGTAVQREGVHFPKDMAKDLRGGHALLSTDFYYFGDQAVILPNRLMLIAQNQRGHRRYLNHPFIKPFVSWIRGLGHEPGALLGNPCCNLFTTAATQRWAKACR